MKALRIDRAKQAIGLLAIAICTGNNALTKSVSEGAKNGELAHLTDAELQKALDWKPSRDQLNALDLGRIKLLLHLNDKERRALRKWLRAVSPDDQFLQLMRAGHGLKDNP